MGGFMLISQQAVAGNRLTFMDHPRGEGIRFINQ